MLLSNCCGIEPSIDYDYPREESKALEDTDDTYLGTLYATSIAGAQQPPNYSGFRPMEDGTDALATRLLMARKAEKSIDAQYYLIKDDIVGRTFLHTLMQAADRGVRVRLLLDDMFTKGYDAGMAALSEHENFEIRVFNPFQRSEVTNRSLAGVMKDFDRINRRMHNKTFTVDNQITIVGGRNMADEYFGVNKEQRFHDDDVLAIGPIVQEVSATFDRYWNHPTALPAPAFVKKVENSKAQRDAIRDAFAATVRDEADSRYSEAVRAKVADYLNMDDDLFRWAPYRLVVDSPNKGVPSRQERVSQLITTALYESLIKAEKELIVVSPYFVPLKSDVADLVQLHEKGIDVIIITNSLAANNMFMVHGGYAPVRKVLLKAGIKIYEVRADSPVAGSEYIDSSHAVTTLHTKEFIVDNKEVFIGSFNFDPRSIKLNTECGVIIRDATLAQEKSRNIHEKLLTHTYELFLNEKGKLRWRTMVDGKEKIERNEPQTSLVQKGLGLFARLVPNSQL